MIEFSGTGDFRKLTKWFEKTKEVFHVGKLNKYGELGVRALRDATPVDTGLTAASWKYEITNKNGVAEIAFLNENIQDGQNIAILIQYGHGTGNGGYVVGRDYINPTIRPLFDEIAENAWKEVLRK